MSGEEIVSNFIDSIPYPRMYQTKTLPSPLLGIEFNQVCMKP